MPGISPKLARQMGLGRSSGRDIVRTSAEIQRYPDAHALRRAWDRMRLDAIVCVDGKPTVYLKEVGQHRASDIRRYQRFVWNQGIATVLVVCTAERIYVYSAMAPPARDDEEPAEGHRLVETLDRTADALEVQLLIRRIETGQIYEDTAASFDRDCAVDQELLRNLRAAAQKLHEIDPTVPYSIICGLLGRVIFTCYLTDRQIIGVDQFKEAGAPGVDNLRDLLERGTLQSGKQALYTLFEQLQPQFNGSIFDEDIAAEKHAITLRHVEVLHQFLRGDNLDTRQRTLGFWAYDFNFIPIETISAIYEGFLGLQDDSTPGSAAGTKRRSGAYYTPKHLAELVIDMGTESSPSLSGKRFLDPACGSGVFLVTIFNRIAEEWRRSNPDSRSATRWRALVDVLKHNLFGVDKDETACRITCFSLYLALLDHFEPRDIREFSAVGRLLPKLLLKEGESAADDEVYTILCRNFFDEDLPLPRDGFDLVTGNPPWVGRNQPKDTKAEKWYRRHVKQTLPGRQVAHAFMWKSSTHANARGDVCLLLPSKVLLNQTDEFQQEWFTRHRVREVLQLSDMSFLLFETAKCPAIAVRYRAAEAEEKDGTIDYVTPQASRTDPRHGTVVIFPEDRKALLNREILYSAAREEAPKLWKTYMRGTPRDLRFIERLSSFPPLGDTVGRVPLRVRKRWDIGQGFKPGKDEKGMNTPWWDENHLFVDAQKRDIDFVLEKNACRPIANRFRELHRLPDKAVFHAPMVLINQGFSKVTYADFDVLFRHSLQSIAGPRTDEDRLIFLCMVLRSRLARYFMFHSAANWGTERDKVHEYELLRLPFPNPETLNKPERTDKLVEDVVQVFRETASKVSEPRNFVSRDTLIQEADEKAETLIFGFYDVDEWEQVLIHDTCDIIEPSATPHSLAADIPTLRPAKAQNRQQYSETICRLLNRWARRSGWKVRAETLASPRTGLGVVSLNRSSTGGPGSDVEADGEVEHTLSRIRGLLPNSAGWRTYMRGLTVFDGDWIHLVKPLILRHWTRTAALNDADELVTAILTSQRAHS